MERQRSPCDAGALKLPNRLGQVRFGNIVSENRQLVEAAIADTTCRGLGQVRISSRSSPRSRLDDSTEAASDQLKRDVVRCTA